MIDLHSHSYYSDGNLSPQKLLEYAASNKITTLALTDHDTVAGIDEAQLAAQNLNINLIPGVEISVSWKKHVIHIIGLKINHKDEHLLRALDMQISLRQKRAEQIGKQLAAIGINNAFDGAKNIAGSRVIARPHFAQFLVEGGFAKDFSSAFKRYLVRAKPGYVSSNWMELSAAVDLINKAGGRAVIAHPTRYKFTKTKLNELITEFKACGGAAMEVIYYALSNKEIELLATLCQNHNLLGSCGSDFHAIEHSRLPMGHLQKMPKNCLGVWHDWNLEQ